MKGKIRLIDIDPWFSKIVKDRDNYTCVLCGTHVPPPTQRIQCSHFWSKGHSSNTRYDLENCDALCGSCHLKYENNKQGIYRDFKVKQLGPAAYEALEWRSKQECKLSQSDKRELLEKFKEQCKGLQYQ